MNRDLVLYVAVVACFAAWITVQVVIAGAFLTTSRKKLGVLALFVPFAAPFLAIRHRERALGVTWLVLGVTYVALRLGACG